MDPLAPPAIDPTRCFRMIRATSHTPLLAAKAMPQPSTSPMRVGLLSSLLRPLQSLSPKLSATAAPLPFVPGKECDGRAPLRFRPATENRADSYRLIPVGQDETQFFYHVRRLHTERGDRQSSRTHSLSNVPMQPITRRSGHLTAGTKRSRSVQWGVIAARCSPISTRCIVLM